AFAIDWARVQAEVARTNRVCSYDRAGSGFSDPATGGPRGGGPADLHVLTRGVDSSQVLRDVHASLTRLSSNSRHTVVAGSGHEIHLFQPDFVVQAIRDVLDALRSKKQLPAR